MRNRACCTRRTPPPNRGSSHYVRIDCAKGQWPLKYQMICFHKGKAGAGVSYASA
jgi:hypothetical protein